MPGRAFARLCLFIFLAALARPGFAQAPAISNPPLSSLVITGQSISKAVGATGAGPLDYRWKRNGQLIAGVTGNALSIANAAAADRGWYEVEVSNASGTARSTFSLEVTGDKGAVVAWGDDYNGQSTISPGLGNVVGIAAGRNTYVLRADGSVVTWGSFGPPNQVAANAVSITAGTNLLAVKADGTMSAAGDNYYGQSTVPSGLSNVVAAAAGTAVGFSVALRADGTVVAWGNGDSGQTTIPAGASNSVTVAAGGSHVLALRGDGTVVAWGYNAGGQTNVPAGLSDVVAVAAGGSHSLALKRDGTVVAWGSNSGTQSSVPAGLNNVIRISAGFEHSLALKADGTVVAWGKTDYTGVNTVPTVLVTAGARAIAAGNNHNVVLIPAVAPQIVTQPASQSAALGSAAQLSVAVTGTRPLLYTWKKGGVALVNTPGGRISGLDSANLALTNIAASDADTYTVEISNGGGTVISTAATLTVAPAPSFSTRPLSRRVQVGQPVTFTAAATGNGAIAYQWRRNGQVIPGANNASYTIPTVAMTHRGAYEVVATDSAGGVSRSVCYLHPTTLSVARSRVASWGNWSTSLVYPPFEIRDPVTVSVGRRLNLALRWDGSVAEWGEQYFDQSSVPEPLTAVAVSAGAEHALALRSNGTVVTWGSGYSGQTFIPAGLRDVIAIAAGDSYSAVLRSDGTLLEWGSRYTLAIPDLASVGNVISIAANSGGILALRADGTVAPLRGALWNPPPPGLAGVTAVAVGDRHYLALKADGTVVGWGTGSAAAIPAGLSNVVDIAAGANHSMAIKADGAIVTWGDNTYAQTAVPGTISSAVAIGAGTYHSVALVPATAPTITAHPNSQSVFAGTTVTFSAGVVGVDPISYQWRKGGAPLTDGNGISGATTQFLMLSNVQAASAGSYTLQATDASGSVVSFAGLLTILTGTGVPPNDTFAAAQVLTGQAGIVTGQNVGATGETGEPAHSYNNSNSAASSVWFTWTPSVSGIARFDTGGSDFTTSLAVYSGNTVSALTLIGRSDAFSATSAAIVSFPVRAGVTYRIAVASATSTRGSIVLNWQLGAAPANDDFAAATVLTGNAGSISGNNTNATGEPGEPLISGYYSSLWYAWTPTVSGKAVISTTQVNFYEVLRVYRGTSLANLTQLGESTGYPGLAVASVSVDVTAGTTYYISVGSVYDNRGTFTLRWDLQTAPVIVTPPSDQTAAVGGTATFTVAATGGGLLYQWFHDGVKIDGATSASLALSNLQRTNAGRYHVVISNLAGMTVSAPVTLGGPNPPPAINPHPASVLVTAGQPASLSVGVSGAGAFSYQWRRKGVALVGQSGATLAFPSASRGDADSYDVFVYDGLSRAQSNRARLDVAPVSYPGPQRFAPAPFQPELDLAGSVNVIATTPGGKFFIGGTFDSVDGKPRSRVARFNADGTIDRDFVPPPIDGMVRQLVPLPGGGILVGGDFQVVDGELRPMLVRLLASGALDTGFSVLPVTGMLSAVAVDGSGRALVAGQLSNTISRNIYRLNADGTLDSSFVGAATFSVAAVAVQPDGRIVIGGSFDSIGNQGTSASRRKLARLLADGSPDLSFDANGWLESGGVGALHLLPDGSVLAGGGFIRPGSSTTAYLVRVTGSGALDTTFVADASIPQSVNGISVQPSGKILVSDYSGALRRLHANGSADVTFAPRFGTSLSYRAAVEADGRILLGSARNHLNAASTIVRLSPEGAPDASLVAVPRKAGSVTTVATLPGGKVLVAGKFNHFGGIPVYNIARLNADGSPDPTYTATNDFLRIYGIFPLPDGASFLFSYDKPVRRLRSDGTLDPSFTLPPYIYAGDPAVAAVLPGGRILASVSGQWAGLPANGLVVINTDGSRDTSFDIGSGVEFGQVKAIAVQDDGRALVGGTFTSFNGASRNRLVRINANGTADPSFQIGTGLDGAVEAIQVLADGKILIAGAFTSCNGAAANYVARLHPNGTRDASFNANVPNPVGAILAQEDGRIIVTARTAPIANQTDYVLRLNSDGTRDGSWLVHGQRGVFGSFILTDAGRLLAGVPGEIGSAYGTGIPFGLAQYAPAAAPTISSPPATVATTAGSTATFTVAAEGTPALRYQWNFNGAPIAGATGSTLTLANVQLANSGAYTVTIRNDFGSITSAPALLQGPNPLPIIAGQPVSASARGGDPVSLSVAANSVGATSYQWRRNGIAIPGATGATLALGAASLTQNGVVYDVVVSDGLSVTVSLPATVTVVPAAYPQVVSADPNFSATLDVPGVIMRKLHRVADGRIYVAGRFSRLGGVPAWNLTRLTAAGAVDPTFRAAVTDGVIDAIAAQPDGKIVIAGMFTRVDGRSLDGIARLGVDGALDTSFAADGNFQYAAALNVQPDGKILVGGGFASGSGLVRLNADGSRDSQFTNAYLSGWVYDLGLQPDGKMVVGGSFSGPGGVIYNRLARLNADGSLDLTFNTGSGPSSTVKSVRILNDGHVLVGGHFGFYNGMNVGRIVRLTSTGAIDPAWLGGTGFTTTSSSVGVERIEIQPDGKILTIGSFISFSGVVRRQLARLNADGQLDLSFVPPIFNSNVNAVTYLESGNVLAGGAFAGNLNVLDNAGAAVANTLSGTVFSPNYAQVMALPAGRVMAAGFFSHVNGGARNGVARLNPDGAVDPTFNGAGTGPSGGIYSLMLQADGRVVIAGEFASYNGTTRPNLARINVDGSLDDSFKPDDTGYYIDSSTRLYPLRRGRMLLFVHSYAQQAYFLRLNADGTRDAAFRAPEGAGYWSSIAGVAEQDNGRLVLVGSFTHLDSTTLNRIVRLMPDGPIDASFNAVADAPVNAVALLPDGKMIIGGDFLTLNGTATPRIARLNSDGSIDSGFQPGFGPNRGIDKILSVGDGRLLVSGRFTRFNGAPDTAFLCRVSAGGALDPTFVFPKLNGPPASLEIHDDGSLLLAGGYGEAGAYLNFGVVRTISVTGPVFATQPQGAAVLAGQRITLSATVSGGQAVAYQWLKDGSAVAGATGTSFTLSAAQAGDSGAYTLRVTSGSTVITSSPANVTVTASAPVFAAEPGWIGGFGGAIALGSRWPLTAPALAAGSGPLAYQWFKDGTLVPGATGRQFLPNWQAEDAGAYQVRISNGLGTVTSATFQQLVTGVRDWQWHHPPPQGNGLAAAAFLNGRFLVGGSRGTILVSHASQGWTIVRLGVSESVFAFAYGNGTYVALSSFGGIWHSTDAIAWTRRDSGVGADGRLLRAVAHGGGRFVAVGDGGLVTSSADGITWTAGSAGTSDHLSAIAYGAGRFVAIGSDGRSFTSSGGAVWQSGATFPQAVSGIAYGSGRFVSVGGGGAAFASNNGTAWTERTISPGASARSVQFAHDRFIVLLAADWSPPSGHYATSTDGLAWSERSFSTVNNGVLVTPTALTFGGDRFVVVSHAGDSMFSSDDGTLWSRYALGASSNLAFSSVAGGTGRMIAGGFNGFAGALWASTDGLTWTVSDSNVPYPIYDVTKGDGRFVAVGLRGLIKFKPELATTWSVAATNTTQHLFGVSHANGRFFATGAGGTLLTTTDPAVWSAATSGTTANLYKVAHGNGTYVAVGAGGTVLTSVDGNSWTTRPVMGVTSNIYTVAFGGDKFVLVSEGGSIRTSTNGATWTAQTNPLGFGFTSLTFAAGRFFAFIAGNTDYLTSSDGVTWLPAQHGNANANIAATEFGNRLFLVGGNLSVVSLPLNLSSPVIAQQPVSTTVMESGSVTLAVGAGGDTPGRYQWFKDGIAIIGATHDTLVLANVRPSDAGRYTVRVSNEVDTIMSSAAVLTVNVITRGLTASQARAGAGVVELRGAFTIDGPSSKQMLIRAVGPTLADFGVTGFLADPTLRVINTATETEAANSNDWESAANSVQVAAVATQVGAYPLPSGSKDAAILATFSPGTYRIVVGPAGESGVASLELYDADVAPRLVYVATRARVGADSPFVKAFSLLAPPTGRSYLVRALGPSLGLINALADPQLRVFSGATELAASDNWGGDPAVSAVGVGVGAMPLPLAGKDAALNFVPATSGVYSIQIAGGDGAALLEIFEADALRAATVPLAVVAPPEPVVVDAGQPASFGIVTVAKPAAVYQWSKGSNAIPGAVGSSYGISRAQVSDAGTYIVVASNGVRTVNASATLTVNPTNNATQAVVGRGYTAGGTVTITNTLHYVGSPSSLAWSVPIPAGWSLASDSGSTGGPRPSAGATGTLTWNWTSPPASPVTFSYTLNVPAGETATVSLAAAASVEAASFAAAPAPLPVILAPPYHSADTNGDSRISLLELTRVIELYNTRNGTSRTGSYRVEAAGEDGFAPEPTRAVAATVTLALYHAADTNRDGRLSLLELTRVIELYNYRNGTTRTGEYRPFVGTEDGFVPGP